MPTIKYLDLNNVSHNLTSYTNKEEADKDLFAWQYVCSRLFKVSHNTIPNSFQYLDVLEDKTQLIQKSLLDQFQERKIKGSTVIDINNFTQHNLISSLKETQAVPQSFEKDYLLLDLLLTQQLLNDKGLDALSGYGKKLITFVESLQSTSFKEVDININLVNDIIENEQKILADKKYEIFITQENIKRANEEISIIEKQLPAINRERIRQKADSEYVSSNDEFSPEAIQSLKRGRLHREKNMNLIDSLKLKVFKYLGKNVNHFYNDNLDKMEVVLEKTLLEKAEKFNLINKDLNKQEITLMTSMEDKKIKILELESILKANESADKLTLTTNLLDDNYIRDVSRIMQENNNIFIHSINDTGFHPDDNSPIHKNISFKDKIDQIRCFSPSVSCSSFQLDKNCKIKDFTSPMGVIVNGGKVSAAFSSDGGTAPNHHGEREFKHTTNQEMSRIINNRSKDDLYDEFAISNTKIAGLYCNYDRMLKGDFTQINKNKGVLTIMEKLINYQSENPEIPLFILKDGNLCQIIPTQYFKEALKEYKQLDKKEDDLNQFSHYSSQDLLDKCFVVSQPKNVQEIVNTNAELEIEKKYEIGSNLITNYKEPFKVVINKKIAQFKSKISELRENYIPSIKTATLKYN